MSNSMDSFQSAAELPDDFTEDQRSVTEPTSERLNELANASDTCDCDVCYGDCQQGLAKHLLLLRVQRDAGAFWRGVFTDDVKGDTAQIEKELADFHFIMGEVPKVYMHVTGGLLSKLKYHAATIIEQAELVVEQRFRDAVAEIRDAVLEQRGPLEGSGMDNDQVNAVLGVIDDVGVADAAPRPHERLDTWRDAEPTKRGYHITRTSDACRVELSDFGEPVRRGQGYGATLQAATDQAFEKLEANDV